MIEIEGKSYQIKIIPWNGIGEQRYDLTVDQDESCRTGQLTELQLRQLIARKNLPRELETELDAVKEKQERNALGEVGRVRQRENDIIENELQFLQPKEKYLLTNLDNTSKEVIVPFGTLREEILRRESSFLRAKPALKLEWTGWVDFDSGALSEEEKLERRQKLRKKKYDIEYQKNHRERIYLSVTREYKSSIEKAAANAGVNVTKFVTGCIAAEEAVREGREIRIQINEKIRDAYEHREDKEQSLAEFVASLLEQALGK